jgi:hypothetical protein
LYRALRKHGIDKFSAEVLWVGPASCLNEKEVYYIAKLHTFIDSPLNCGYNLTTGGGQRKLLSKCSRRKISEAAKVQFSSKEARAELSARKKRQYIDDPTLGTRCAARPEGYIVSVKTRKLLSTAGKKRYADPVERQLTSERGKLAYRLNPPKPRSEETKARQSTAAKQRWAKQSERDANAMRKRAEWADPVSRAHYMAAQSAKAAKMAALWADPVYKQVVSKSISQGKQRARERELAGGKTT